VDADLRSVMWTSSSCADTGVGVRSEGFYKIIITIDISSRSRYSQCHFVHKPVGRG
jgi:hypothetical protein